MAEEKHKTNVKIIKYKRNYNGKKPPDVSVGTLDDWLMEEYSRQVKTKKCLK